MRSKIAVIFLLALLIGSIGLMDHGSATESIDPEIEEISINKDIRAEKTNETEETDNSFWGKIEEAIGKILDAFVGMITAFPLAIAEIFGSWAGSLAGPLGILFAGGVIFALFILWRVYGVVDQGFDKLF